MLSAQAFCANDESVEMPTTWAFSPAKRLCAASYAGNCELQTGVNENGKNAMTTFDFPR